MINFRLDSFVMVLRLIAQETQAALRRAEPDPQAPLDQESNDRARFNGNFEYITRHCTDWLLSQACSRVERISTSLRTNPRYSYFELANDLNVLMQAIEDDIKFERFFHYRQDRARPLITMQGEWAATVTAFPSVEKEIERGLDCYGFEDYDACIFHLMRIAEIGMRALARERRVSFPKHPLEWADWQTILDETEKRARAVTVGMSRGPKRDAMQAFYNGATGQLHGFKDTFRNAVMHARKSYDELEARRAINQVRDFMNGLSARIGEKTKKPIPLSRWP